jgi:hypothetical protein
VPICSASNLGPIHSDEMRNGRAKPVTVARVPNFTLPGVHRDIKLLLRLARVTPGRPHDFRVRDFKKFLSSNGLSVLFGSDCGSNCTWFFERLGIMKID